MEAAWAVVADGSPADIVISQSHQVFRRSNGGRAQVVNFAERWPIAYRALTPKPLEGCGGKPQHLGVSAGFQAGLELLQSQLLQVGLRRAGGTDHADLDAGCRIDGGDLDREADGSEFEITPAGRAPAIMVRPGPPAAPSPGPLASCHQRIGNLRRAVALDDGLCLGVVGALQN